MAAEVTEQEQNIDQQLNQSHNYEEEIYELVSNGLTFPNHIESSIQQLIENIQIEEGVEKLQLSNIDETLEVKQDESENKIIEEALNKLIQHFNQKEKVQYPLDHLSKVQHQDNTIQVNLKEIKWDKNQTILYLYLCISIQQLRNSVQQKLSFDSSQEKNILDDDVYLLSVSISEEQITFNFIILDESTLKDLQYLEEEQRESSKNIIQEDKPWYGEKRYDIVDHVLDQLAEKDRMAQLSAVQTASLQAQQQFLTQSMRELGPEYDGPQKYLNQKDSPLEIPVEVIKKLFKAMDLDLDDRISVQELQHYCKLKFLPFKEEEIQQIFEEATSGRAIVHEKQKYAPLTLDEVAAAVRGRHKWNTYTKQWEVYYRPCRDYWVILLKTVQERLFAMPIPKIIPTKILAQFEEEELKSSTIKTKKEGIDKKYMSIKEKEEPLYQKDLAKKEAGLNFDPETLVKYEEKKSKVSSQNPYEQQINGRLRGTDNGFQKMTFESKEFFNQAKHLSEHIPFWQNDKENPIFQYVPTSERPFTNDSELMFDQKHQNKMLAQSLREQKLYELQGKERTLRLAGTMALKTQQFSAQDAIRERQGFMTAFKIPTIFDQKTEAAMHQKNSFNKNSQEYKPIQDPYMPPSDHKFRDLELNRGQKDFTLRFKCAPPYNPYGVSEHDLRPKEVLDRQRRQEEREREEKKVEYQTQIRGKPLQQKDWIQYHKLPDKLVPVGEQFKERNEGIFLQKDEYTSEYTQLARQMKDDVVFGKPNFNLYFKGLKPSDLQEEFGGTKTKPYKCIY